MRLFISIIATSALVFGYAATPVLADWDPNDAGDQDAVKMHFAQLPDTTQWGIDVHTTCYTQIPLGKIIADDWMCTEAGRVMDIHFWFSAYNDWFNHLDLSVIDHIHVGIHANIPEDPPAEPFSRPGDVLWERDFTPYDPQVSILLYHQRPQGWYDPNTGIYLPINHSNLYQCNLINLPEPFLQTEGEIYWLAVYIYTTSESPDSVFGWKTADLSSYPPPYTGSAYMDDAVWGECADLPMPFWAPLVYPPPHPETGTSLDLAFVITSPGIPTLSVWGLVALVLLLLLTAGIILFRRRRAAEA